MNIKEFASQYCSDITAETKRRPKMSDLSGFSYGEITKEDDGTEARVVNTINYQTLIIDILGMSRIELSKVWSYMEYVGACGTYVNNLIIVEGEDALIAVRNMPSREQEKITMYDNIPEVFR